MAALLVFRQLIHRALVNCRKELSALRVAVSLEVDEFGGISKKTYPPRSFSTLLPSSGP